MGELEEDCKKYTKFSIIILISVCVLIVFPFLLGYSFDIVEPLEYGIDINNNTLEIDQTTLYSSGRYFLGVNHYFLKFPRTNLYLQSKFAVRSNEGLKINFQVSLSFKLGTAITQKDLLSQFINIYSNVSYNWNDLVIRILQQTSRDILANYSASDIIIQREKIGADVLFKELKSDLNVRFFSLTSLNIISIELNGEYLNSLIEMEKVNQKGEEMNYLLQGLNVEAVTNVTIASIESQALDYESKLKVEVNKKNRKDEIDALGAKIKKLYSNLVDLKNKLNISNKANQSIGSQILQYYFTKIMQNEGNKNSKLKLNLPESLRENN